jgi:two-component system, chemotaxis family, response regulator Rcp1
MPIDFHILLIEDSPADVLIIQRALAEMAAGHRLTVVAEGGVALDQLRRLRDPSTPSDLEPDLILLDLNLPGLDGHQVLSEIKSDPYLRSIPLVVLTTSDREEDILRSYSAGANSYIQKPSEFPNYIALAETLRRYWVDTSLRPGRHRPRA